MKIALPILAFLLIGAARAEPAAPAIAEKGCAVLAARVDAIAGGGPALLRSFDNADNPALAQAAFTYDNALAVIALTACHREAQARRLGDGLLLAVGHDRAGPQGRLRNAYRAGPQPAEPPPNGWWDAARGAWLEDQYQVGTATGVAAWAGLALMTLSEQSAEPRYRDGAARLGQWVIDHADGGKTGFNGGIFGGEATPRQLSWKSTEQNTDLVALFRWLAHGDHPERWSQAAARAQDFVASQWDDASGHFLTGTLTDGLSENRATSGLDAQLWPLLLPDAPQNWRRALDYAQRAHGVDGGFAFNDDHGGLWSEGTAQAALSFRAAGRAAEAARSLGRVSGLFSPTGYVWATPNAKISTGLAIGPDSLSADFFYFHLPHLGATAWAVIAAQGWNPFTGKRLTN